MRRVLVAFILLLGVGLLAACTDVPPTPTLTPTATLPGPIPTPALPSVEYRLSALAPDESLAFLDEAIAELATQGAYAASTGLATQIDIAAREVRGESAGNLARRAHAAWRAAQAYHLVGDTDQSLAWLRPALLDSLNAGMVVLQPPPYAFRVEGISGEVDAMHDLDGDGVDEWLLWLRFDTPPHASVVLALKQAPDGAYTIMPVEGDWPQVGAGGTLLVEAMDDLNADGRPEIVVSAYTCNDTGCAGELFVFAWREGSLVSLVQVPEQVGTRGIPLRDTRWNISDSDDDGVVEIATIADRVDTFGWGCAWQDIAVYEWTPAADAYTLVYSTPPYFSESPDPRCLMATADQAIDEGEYRGATLRLSALLEMPPERLQEFGDDFEAFAYFRRGVAHALRGRPSEAVRDMETARHGPFMDGLVSAFLDNYHEGATPHTACAVAAHYAVTTTEAYDLVPIATYGQLPAARVCRGQDEIQRLIAKDEWNTDSPLADQLDAAGIPLLAYQEVSVDGDPDPEAFALTQTDFPFVWLFDAQPDASIRATRVATVKQGLSLSVYPHDLDGDGAPEAFIMVGVRDERGARCQGAGRATRLYAVKLTGEGRVEALLPEPGFVVDCRPPAVLQSALAADALQITVTNNVGVSQPTAYTYQWAAGRYVKVEYDLTAAPAEPPAYAHPDDADRAQLAQAKDEMFERGDLALAWGRLEPLADLPAEETAPDFQYEVRYLVARWRELNGEADAAREAYYSLWRDAPGSPWAELAQRKLEGP